MMKFHATIVTCLATYFVSGVSQESEAFLALSQQLRQTDHSLELMKSLEKRKDTDPEGVTSLLLSATEPAAQGQSELDRRLHSLKQELSVLYMETEIILGLGGASEHNAIGQAPLAGNPMHKLPVMPAGGLEIPEMVTGLSPRVLAILRSQRMPRAIVQAQPMDMQSKSEIGEVMSDSMAKSKLDEIEAPQPKPIKLTGYSADPMAQARVCYRAKLYEECLMILKKQTGSKAEHLRSRCYTQLDRADEAILSLSKIIKAEPESKLGMRAKQDMEFAMWRMQAKQKMMKDTDQGSGK
jgi:hypothetical protein